jgi:hypothetical protein
MGGVADLVAAVLVGHDQQDVWAIAQNHLPDIDGRAQPV